LWERGLVAKEEAVFAKIQEMRNSSEFGNTDPEFTRNLFDKAERNVTNKLVRFFAVKSGYYQKMSSRIFRSLSRETPRTIRLPKRDQ